MSSKQEGQASLLGQSISSLVTSSTQLWLVHAAGDWLGLLRQLLCQHGVVGLLKRRVAAVCIGHGGWEPLKEITHVVLGRCVSEFLSHRTF